MVAVRCSVDHLLCPAPHGWDQPTICPPASSACGKCLARGDKPDVTNLGREWRKQRGFEKRSVGRAVDAVLVLTVAATSVLFRLSKRRPAIFPLYRPPPKALTNTSL